MRSWCRRAGVRAAAAVAVLAVVAVGCGGGGDGGEQGYVQPKGPAAEDVAIDAGNFFFDPDDITLPPGIARLELNGVGGIHTLVFDDGAYPGFQLEVSGSQTDGKKIELEPGKYTFYCDIPGHRQQGMVGELDVT